jgi:hypothetical protein
MKAFLSLLVATLLLVLDVPTAEGDARTITS